MAWLVSSLVASIGATFGRTMSACGLMGTRCLYEGCCMHSYDKYIQVHVRLGWHICIWIGDCGVDVILG